MKELNEVHFLDSCVIEDDFVYVASCLDALNSQADIHSRMSVYDAQSSGKWFYHDVHANIVSVCVKKRTSDEGRLLCALSKEGEIELYSNKNGSSTQEKISDAGLRLGTLGYMTSIRQIGESLYACGANDQVYQRTDGTWKSLTELPLKFRSALDSDYGFFSSIDGTSETDIYVCGLQGRLFHFDGKQWRKITLNTDENLNCVRCFSEQEIWICGNNGTLLKGNVQDGFKDVSSIDDNDTFWSLAKFQNQIYLASLHGLYVFDGSKISLVKSNLLPEIQTYKLDATENVLWSFGVKDITCFDGQNWERIHHPDNP